MSMDAGEKRQIALKRAAELKERIAVILNIKNIPTGFKEWEKIKRKTGKN